MKKKRERLRAPGSGLQVPDPDQLTFVFEEILDRVSGPFEREVGRERPKR